MTAGGQGRLGDVDTASTRAATSVSRSTPTT